MAVEPNQRDAERERILQLLPWRASGRLDAKQSADVNRAIAADLELAQRLDLMREEAAGTIAVNEQLGAPSAASFGRLMAELDAMEGGTMRRESTRDRLTRWFGWLAAPDGLRIAAAAAALIIVLQAGVIGYMLSRETGTGQYQTAAGQQQTAQGPHILAVFAENTRLSEINELLGRFQARITDGPRAGGFYRISFTKDDAKQPDVDGLARALTDSGLAVTVLSGGQQ